MRAALAVLAAACAAASTAAAQERAADAPVLSPPRPVSLPSMQPLSLSAPALPAAALPASALPVAAAAAPQGSASPAPAPAPARAQAAPVLPPVLPAAAVAAPKAGAAAPGDFRPVAGKSGATRQGQAGPDSSPEAGLAASERLFDNALAADDAPLTVFPSADRGSPAAERYADALHRAERQGWSRHGAEVADAAAALLAERGVKAQRRAVAAPGGGFYEAVTVAPERGVSPLNDLAFELRRALGTSVEFIPQRTAGASAAYNAKENRLLLTGLDRADFYLAALHEARHAWYSALLRRGEIGLFHVQAVAKPGLAVAPEAQTYVSYLSFEELSTFPKTLKHMLTERAKLSAAGQAEAARYLDDRLVVRARQLADILRSADFMAGQMAAAARRGAGGLRRMSEKEVAATDLQPLSGMDYFELELPRAWLYFPVARRKRRVLGFTSVKSSAKEARAALALRARLIRALVADSAAPLSAYYEAARAGDLAEASRQADRLITLVKAAEKQFKDQGRS